VVVWNDRRARLALQKEVEGRQGQLLEARWPARGRERRSIFKSGDGRVVSDQCNGEKLPGSRLSLLERLLQLYVLCLWSGIDLFRVRIVVVEVVADRSASLKPELWLADSSCAPKFHLPVAIGIFATTGIEYVVKLVLSERDMDVLHSV
jgi:hypothetical protein